MSEMTSTQALEAAKVYVDNELHDLCEEIIAWDEQKVRPGDKLNELFRICSYAKGYNMRLAKQLISDAAIRQV